MLKNNFAALKTPITICFLIVHYCPLNFQHAHRAALVDASDKQLIIQATPNDQFTATAIPEVQFAQVSEAGVHIVNQNPSSTKTLVYFSSFDSFPGSWEKATLDLSSIEKAVIDFKIAPLFHFSKDGRFLLVVAPQDRSDNVASRNEAKDDVIYRFGVWRFIDREYRFVGFVQIPSVSHLNEGTQASFLTNLNTNMVVAIDYYGVPSILDLGSQSLAPISFESCRGKLDPSVFCSEENKKIVSFSVSDGYDRVLDFAVWNLEGSLLCDREFLIEGNAEADFIGRRQSGMFISDKAFLVFDRQFTGVAFGKAFDKFFRIDLHVPNGYQIVTIVKSSSEFLTAFAVPSTQGETGITILRQDFHLYLEPADRISVTPNGWTKTAVEFMPGDILQN